MVVVKRYDNDIAEFYCSKCDFYGEYNIKSLLNDNCVCDVDIVCDMCGGTTVLYVLKCSDPAQAKELNARLEFLKCKRAAEGKEDGNQINEH